MTSVSFLSYNIDGFASKTQDADFVHFVNKFDFVGLLETFVSDVKTNVFSNYVMYVTPAIKLSNIGRKSGGVIVMVKKMFAKFVERIYLDCNNIIILKLSSNLFESNSDIFLVCAYLPPVNSPFYAVSDSNDSIEILETCILQIVEKYGDVYFFICGDLNARTANKQPLEKQSFEPNFDQWNDKSTELYRNSQDQAENDFGKKLLDLCSVFFFNFLNGNCKGDQIGWYTFISSTGNSVIDYFIISRAIADLPVTMNVEERIDSQHMPITCMLKRTKAIVSDSVNNRNVVLEKLVWDSNNVTIFKEELNRYKDYFNLATNQVFSDIHEAANVFTSILVDVSSCMQKKIIISNQERKRKWFDQECKTARTVARQALRKYRSSNLDEDRDDYLSKRKDYKQLLKTKSDTKMK